MSAGMDLAYEMRGRGIREAMAATTSRPPALPSKVDPAPPTNPPAPVRPWLKEVLSRTAPAERRAAACGPTPTQEPALSAAKRSTLHPPKKKITRFVLPF